MRDLLDSILDVQVPLFFIVVLRLAVGAGFVYQGYEKVQDEYLKPIDPEDTERSPALKDRLARWMLHKSTIYTPEGEVMREVRMFRWYQQFLEQAVLENVAVFSTLVAVGELAVGGLLILGFLVRAASFVGIVLCLNYLFVTWHLLFPYPHLNILCVVILLVFALASAGRCLGIDARLHERFPEIPLF
jgi:NADH dehydrogenase